MQCVRINFSKTGRVKYVSHLDIMRCFSRAVRRADIPLWYTEGFNPHPYLNFLQPLPLGVEGMCEPLDIRIEGDISFEEIQVRLNEVLPEGIMIIRAYEPYLKHSEIAFGEYEIQFEKEENFITGLNEAMDSGELKSEKMGKVNGRKRIKEINISENIKKYSTSETDDAIIMNVILPCGNEKNVNPMNLISSLKQYMNLEFTPLNIKRLRLLDGNMSSFE